MAGPSHTYTEPGDYTAVDVGPYPIVVLRDDDGHLRAFHNVCRHRGARLLADERGSVGNLVCGYHRWTYGTDGVNAVYPFAWASG